MTKTQIIEYILGCDFSSLDNRLDKLMAEGRITSGARYSVYNPYHIYSLQAIQELVDKASNSKNYFRYLKRIDSIQYSVWLRMFNEDLDKIKAFLEEQENLPFEETQKQVLIQNGKI